MGDAVMCAKPGSTVAFEKRCNPMLSMNKDDFVASLTQTIPPRTAEMERMVAYNLGNI